MTDFYYNIPEEDFSTVELKTELFPNFYMGMSPFSYDSDAWDLIINCEPSVHSYLWQTNSNTKTVFIHFPMWDRDDFELEAEKITPLALTAVHYALANKKVLVHCSAGLNRSGVIAAVACWLYGIDDPISYLKDKRNKWALCNLTFEKWIRDNYYSLTPVTQEA